MIALSSALAEGDELVIEYKSDGVSEGLTLIPSEMEPAVTAGAKMFYYEDKDPRLAQVFQAKWEQEYGLLKKLYNRKPVDYLTSLLQEHHRPAPR